MAETEAEVDGPGRSGGTLAWFILAAELLYVPSVGPVAAFWIKLKLPEVWLTTFYAPLIWVHDRTPLEQPLNWHLEVCDVK